MAAMTLEPASPLFEPEVRGNLANQFNPLVQWYRERPSQVAFAASIVFHALVIAFIPGLRPVSIETQRVLTVRIAEPAPVVEQPVARRPVARQPVVRETDPLPEPVLLPEFEPAIAQPRVLEQAPVRPQQAFEPQPMPVVQQAEQTTRVEQIARADLSPPISRDEIQPQPVIVARPDFAPAQTVIPVIESKPVPEVERADLAPPIVRDKSQLQPAIVARPEVAPAQAAVPVIESRPIPQVKRPDEPVTEVRPQPRAMPQVTNPTRPQPAQDVPRPATQPVQVQEQPLIAAPTVPVPHAVAPIARSALPQASPPVSAAPVQPGPQNTAPIVAMPSPQTPLVVVEPAELEAYRQSVSKEVMKHMRYPHVAVMRKWQGKTIVEMKLSADGEVIQVVVAESSGKEVLDEAALKMVRRSLPLPKPPQGVRTVIVPVIFRLQG
jgi:protein TonB